MPSTTAAADLLAARFKAGELEEAIELYTLASEKDPENHAVQLAVGPVDQWAGVLELSTRAPEALSATAGARISQHGS